LGCGIDVVGNVMVAAMTLLFAGTGSATVSAVPLYVMLSVVDVWAGIPPGPGFCGVGLEVDPPLHAASPASATIAASLRGRLKSPSLDGSRSAYER